MKISTEQTISVDRWRKPAELLRLVAHPVRLMILSLLCEKPQCVKDLNSLVPVVQPHLSQHMAALREAQLIDYYTSGTLRCYYVIKPSLVHHLIALVGKEHLTQNRDRSWVIRKSREKGNPVGRRNRSRFQKTSSIAKSNKHGED
jgi:ArsR family transcriptional regulator